MPLRVRFLLVLPMLWFFSPLPASSIGWESMNGPFRTEKRFHTRFPDGERVLVGTRYGTFRSNDGGVNWVNLGGPPAAPRSLQQAPNGALYCVSDTAVFSKPGDGPVCALLRSTDRGRNWTSLGLGYNLAIAVGSGDTVYKITGRSDIAFGATSLLKSTDAGLTWTPLLGPIGGPPTLGFADVRVQHNNVFAMHSTIGFPGDFTERSTNGGTTWQTLSCLQAFFTPPQGLLVYRRNFDNAGQLSSGGNLDYSTNSGVSWTTSLTSDSGFSSLISNGNGTLLVMSAPGDTVKRSTNGGLTWARVGQSPPGDRFVKLMFIGNTNLVGIAKSGLFYRSSDYGSSWQLMLNDVGFPLTGVLESSTDSLLVVADGSGNWLESLNGGAAWTARSVPFQMDDVNAVMVLPSNSIVTGGASGLSRIRESNRWVPFDSPGPVFGLSYESGNQFYAGTGRYDIGSMSYNGGVFRFDTSSVSLNGSPILNGGSDYWSSYPDIASILALPDGSLLAGMGHVIVSRTGSGPGWNFSSTGTGTHSGFVRDRAGSIYSGSIGSGVYRSTNQGGSWVQVNNGLGNMNVYSLACDSLGQIIAGTGAGAYRTADKGATWYRMPNGLPDIPVKALTVAPNGCIYAGTNNYVYVNIGNYWVHLRDGLEESSILSMAVQGENTILAGTTGSGLFARGGFRTMAVPPFTGVSGSPVLSDVSDVRSVAWGDYDNDGDADLFIANGKGQNNNLYRNDGGVFVKIVVGTIVNDGGDSRSAAWGDYDDDGYVDLFVANYNQANLLYHNNGNGSFTKIASGPVVADVGASSGCAWADYDNDGYLDLFVANNSNQANFLYHNNGDGTFTTISAGAIVMDLANSVACAWGDYNADGYQDLYVANANQSGALYKNNGNGSFARVFTSGLTARSADVRGCGWADFSNDGLPDLWIAGGSGVPIQLLVNRGDGSFSESSGDMLWTDADAPYSIAFGDIDNDNDLDMFAAGVGMKSMVYINDGGGGFVRTMSGSAVIGQTGDGPVSLVDFNGDGKVDLFVGNAGGTRRLYMNDGNGQNGLNVKLEGTLSDKRGVGAQVGLTAAFESYPVWLQRTSSGRDDIPLHFGIRTVPTIDTIRVRWPVTGLQILTNVPVSGLLTIKEPGERALPGIQFPPNGAIDISTTVTLIWRPNAGAAQFHLQVSSDSLFRSFEYNDSTLTDSAKQLGPFNLFTTYYWRVRAVGGISATDWTPRWRFTTVASVPGLVVLLSPPMNATSQPPVGLLRWARSERATRYQLQLARDSLFMAHVVLNDSTIVDTIRSYSVAYDSQYYWRVRAINGSGAGPFSSVSAFRTVQALPSAVQLVYPASGATVTSTVVAFIWQHAVPEVTRYWFELATDSAFAFHLTDSSIVDTTYIRQGLAGGTYWWRVKGKNVAGWGEFGTPRRLFLVLTGIAAELEMPKEYSLSQNYPNPFNPTTMIRFALPVPSHVRLTLFNPLGQEIMELLDGERQAGYHEIGVDARGLPSGLYFYRMQAGEFVQTKRLMVLK